MSKDTLGDRIKKYEAVSKHTLLQNSPLVIRIDGRTFHTFTKKVKAMKPFDIAISESMIAAAKATAEDMQGFKLAYIQSDEATFVLTDYDTHEMQGWFGHELNKVVSLSASVFTAHFNKVFQEFHDIEMPLAYFDSRAFTVPKEEVPNVILWRQIDWERNSLQMLSRFFFSHKELDGKKRDDMIAMLNEKNQKWDDLNDREKWGTFIGHTGETWHAREDYESLSSYMDYVVNKE